MNTSTSECSTWVNLNLLCSGSSSHMLIFSRDTPPGSDRAFPYGLTPLSSSLLCFGCVLALVWAPILGPVAWLVDITSVWWRCWSPCRHTSQSLTSSRGNVFAVSSPDCRHPDKENFFKGRYCPACNWVNIFCKPDSFANIMVGWDSIGVRAHLG